MAYWGDSFLQGWNSMADIYARQRALAEQAREFDISEAERRRQNLELERLREEEERGRNTRQTEELGWRTSDREDTQEFTTGRDKTLFGYDKERMNLQDEMDRRMQEILHRYGLEDMAVNQGYTQDNMRLGDTIQQRQMRLGSQLNMNERMQDYQYNPAYSQVNHLYGNRATGQVGVINQAHDAMRRLASLTSNEGEWSDQDVARIREQAINIQSLDPAVMEGYLPQLNRFANRVGQEAGLSNRVITDRGRAQLGGVLNMLAPPNEFMRDGFFGTIPWGRKSEKHSYIRDLANYLAGPYTGK